MKKQKKMIPDPLQGNHQQTPLVGHSGCKIVLIQNSMGAKVRKTSKSIDYNSRLKKQCEKQKKFDGKNGVRAPKILSQGLDDSGLFYFDMEYISGQSMASFIENESGLSAKWMAEKLVSLLDWNHSLVDPSFSKKFEKKIESLEKQLTLSSKVEEALDVLKGHPWSPGLVGNCHGDLTFENIIRAGNGDIYLIDFLDSFCESWIMDLSKLLQDLELQWSFRSKNSAPFINIRLHAILKEMLLMVESHPNGQEVICTAYHALLLNVLRIIPYSSDEMKPYIDELLKKTLQRIHKMDFRLKGAS